MLHHMAKYLIRSRHRTLYYVRVVVPRPLRSIVGRSEIRRSLGSDCAADVRLARLRAVEFAHRAALCFRALRSAMPKNPLSASPSKSCSDRRMAPSPSKGCNSTRTTSKPTLTRSSVFLTGLGPLHHRPPANHLMMRRSALALQCADLRDERAQETASSRIFIWYAVFVVSLERVTLRRAAAALRMR